MNKSEVVHTRIEPEIKERADEIFEELGLTTSQAISLFLIATVNNNGLPFELKINQRKKDVDFARAILSVDGQHPSKDADYIMSLYADGKIDLEEAKKKIEEIYK